MWVQSHTRTCQDGGPLKWLDFTFMACEFLQPSLLVPPLGTSFESIDANVSQQLFEGVWTITMIRHCACKSLEHSRLVDYFTWSSFHSRLCLWKTTRWSQSSIEFAGWCRPLSSWHLTLHHPFRLLKDTKAHTSRFIIHFRIKYNWRCWKHSMALWLRHIQHCITTMCLLLFRLMVFVACHLPLTFQTKAKCQKVFLYGLTLSEVYDGKGGDGWFWWLTK